jgi:integrase
VASITKRGPGQWQAKVRRKGWPHQHETFTTKGDAEAWAREIENEMDRGVFVSRKEAESTTLREALERFRKEKIPTYAHPKKEENRLDHLLQYSLVDMHLGAIRGKHIAEFIELRIDEGVSGNTIRLDLAMLSKLFSMADRNWGMESLNNPIRKVYKPELPQGRERRLMLEVLYKGKIISEEELILEHAHKDLVPIIKFALETTMRRGEIANLTWEKINLKAQTICLPKTKNHTARTIPLSAEACAVLESQFSNNIKPIYGKVFKLSEDRITKLFRKMRKHPDVAAVYKDVKIEELHFHDLRHESISRFFENTDLDFMEIQGITGHKTLQMLKRYTHLSANRLVGRLNGKKRGK